MSQFFAELRRLKRNEVVKASKRNMHLSKKKGLLSSKGYGNIKEFDFPEVSKTELRKMKSRIRRSIKIERKKHLVILTILITITTALTFHFVDFSNKEQPVNEKLNENNYLETNINEYSYLIDDGDKWIEKRNWNNAIFRYKQAIKLFPNDYEANYRLALAYSYNCQSENKNCEKGYKLVEKLTKYYPNEANLVTLKSIFEKDS